jgi:hypothetical protein
MAVVVIFWVGAGVIGDSWSCLSKIKQKVAIALLVFNFTPFCFEPMDNLSGSISTRRSCLSVLFLYFRQI